MVVLPLDLFDSLPRDALLVRAETAEGHEAGAVLQDVMTVIKTHAPTPPTPTDKPVGPAPAPVGSLMKQYAFRSSSDGRGNAVIELVLDAARPKEVEIIIQVKTTPTDPHKHTLDFPTPP